MFEFFESQAFFLISSLVMLGGILFLIPYLNGRSRDLSLSECGAVARNPVAGIPMTAIAFLWVIPHAAVFLNMLRGAPDYWRMLPFAGIACVLCCVFLDFLFARALGGLLILWCGFALHTLFNVPHIGFFMPIFSTLTLPIMLAGLMLCGIPRLLRDFLYGFGHTYRAWQRHVIVVYLSVYALLLLLECCLVLFLREYK